MGMEQLGPSLWDVREFCGGTFSMKTTVMIGIQMVIALERIHDAGFIHRDIKPENVCLGLGKTTNNIRIIDFGLAKNFR